jgi:phosphatidyl-myo-inositol alpha-mannosyltransferase
MRICLVTPYDLSHEGGVNRHVRSLAAAMRALGHEARVMGPASGAVPEGCDGLPGVVPVPANGSVARIGLLVPWRDTARLLRRERYDVVHLHEPFVPGPTRQALRIAEAPVVATFHAASEAEGTVRRWVRHSTATRAERIAAGIAVSRAAKRFARAVYQGRLALIPNGVDLELFTLRHRLAPVDMTRRPRVLFVGRFGERRKGFGVLLAAAARLGEEGRPIDVTVAGDGPRERFAGRASPVGVRFAGRLDDAELAAAYREADLLCAPSLGGESFGMVLVEAMASGCPVVATSLPGYTEAAAGAARLCPPGDAAALAEAIWSVATDASVRDRLAALGRARAEALGWDRLAARVLCVYDGALGLGRATRAG